MYKRENQTKIGSKKTDMTKGKPFKIIQGTGKKKNLMSPKPPITEKRTVTVQTDCDKQHLKIHLGLASPCCQKI